MSDTQSHLGCESAPRTSTELDQLTGTLTHHVVQTLLADFWREGLGGDVPAIAVRMSEAVVAASSVRPSQRRRTTARVATGACSYLLRHCPAPPVEFITGEYPLGDDDGAVDLLWAVPGHGMLVDELKTSRHPDVPDRDRAQCTRYARAGYERFGTEFLGVRYLPLLYPQQARLITFDGNRILDTSLTATPFAWGFSSMQVTR